MRTPRALALAAVVALAACNPPTVQPTGPGTGKGGGGGVGAAPGTAGSSGTPGSGGGGGAGGAKMDGPGFGFGVPDGGGAPPSMPPPGTVPPGGGEGNACAARTTKAEQVPVDLLVLFDTSGSMEALAGTRTKLVTARDALLAFTRDTRSAGLGLGLQVFPYPMAPKECTADTQCPPSPGPLFPIPSRCAENEFCVGGTIPAGMPFRCLPTTGANRCPVGSTCRPGGVCTLSREGCTTPNMPCPGGRAGDMCRPAPRLCSNPGSDSCDLADYRAPLVPIAALPGNEAPFVQALMARVARGGTPTGAAVQGALAHLQMHQTANPGRRVALILTTDGIPTSCMPMTADGIAADIRRAAMGNPSIPTYVIGVFTMTEVAMARPTLETWATAGATGMPFVLTATDDLGQRLQDALNQIRGSALPCEFMIPPPMGGPIDYSKVNVQFTGGGAVNETIPYVERMDRCDPMRGGWYYDVNPTTGMPSRIIVCDASCKRFKTAPNASVSLAFGCKTEVIQ